MNARQLVVLIRELPTLMGKRFNSRRRKSRASRGEMLESRQLLTVNLHTVEALDLGGANTDYITASVVDENGNQFYALQFRGTVDVDPGPVQRLVTSSDSGSSTDYIVFGLGPADDYLWHRHLEDSSSSDRIFSLAMDDRYDRVFVAGRMGSSMTVGLESAVGNGSRDGFFFSINAGNGDVSEIKSIGGPDGDEVRDIDVDGAGNVYVTGVFTVSASMGLDNYGNAVTITGSSGLGSVAPSNGFVAKYDLEFDVVRAGAIVSDQTVEMFGIASDIWGYAAVTGTHSGSANFNLFGGTDIRQAPTGVTQGFIARYGDTFTRHVIGLGSAGGTILRDIEIPESSEFSDRVFVVGQAYGTVDFNPIGSAPVTVSAEASTDAVIASYNLSGDLVFVHTAGGTGEETFYSISVLDNVVLATGETRSASVRANQSSVLGTHSSGGGYDELAMIVKNNAPLAMGVAGGPGDERLFASALTGLDTFVTAGLYSGIQNDVAFGPDTRTLPLHGNADGFVAKHELVTLPEVPAGSALKDLYTLTLSTGVINVKMQSGNGPVTNVGDFSLTGPALTFNGMGGTDTIFLVGSAGNDLVELTQAGLIVNGLTLNFDSIESATMNGGSGADVLTVLQRPIGVTSLILNGAADGDHYRFDTDTTLGVITLSDTLGGIDTLDFSLSTSTGVSVNAALATMQVINTNLSLILGAATSFENLVGTNENDTLLGNTLANRFDGGPGTNILTGGTGNDVYVFDADTDIGTWVSTVTDSGGVDVLDFSSTTGTGISVSLGLTGAQVLNPNHTLILVSATAIDSVSGSQLNDIIIGNTLANRLEGNGGDDQLQGVSGNDVYVFNADVALGTDILTDPSGTETLDFSTTLTTGVTVSLGSAAAQVVNGNLTILLGSPMTFDNLTGSQADDSLAGNAGTNVISGNGGSDVLRGGAGNDTYAFAANTQLGTDTIDDSAGIDTLNFSSTTAVGVSVNLGTLSNQVTSANLSLLLTSISSIENLFGSTQNDTLTGNGLANAIDGGAANDLLDGAGGNDTLIGAAGDDALHGGTGDDTFVFDTDLTLGSDTVSDSAGSDMLSFSTTTTRAVTLNLGTTSAQTVNAGLTLTLLSDSIVENITGGSLNDILTGNGLANKLIGGPGNDTLAGAEGDDVYSFDADIAQGIDTLNEAGGGLDTIDFTGTTVAAISIDLSNPSAQVVNGFLSLILSDASTFEKVIGSSQADTILGNGAANILLGMLGNDTISGGAGRDLLIGGGGADTINGGADDDLLIAGTTNYDTIASSLSSILTEWSGSNSYAVRVSNLRTGAGGLPILNKTVTVKKDSLVNTLTGSAGQDWYFANAVGTGPLDILFDQDLLSELLDEL